jgi:hypothetical protein
MLVLLLVNYNFLRRRNLVEGSFTAALRGQ